MPGIAGIVVKNERDGTSKDLQFMVKRMIHEKFYKSGTYENDRLGLWLGWVCLENSFSDCLPIWNERKDICLVFTGEHAADESEAAQLRVTGHKYEFINASYLVHLYENDGIGFLKKLNGSFSGVLIDLREDKAILFNDRFGLSRIYYYEDQDAFYFSSEAKSILSVILATRRLDNTSLGEFFALGCTLEDKSLFAGISLLPGGSMWGFSADRRVTKGTYFSRETWENQPALNAASYYEKLKETFPHILQRYFHHREKVGVSLTGGIDTRMIMAWASFPPLKVPCFTFGGMYRDCADVRIARRVAQTCQQTHTTIGVNRKFFSEFPALAKRAVYYTDGAMNTGGAVELYVNRIAREIAPIRLTGNYGDQVVRRAIGFSPLSLCQDIFSPDFRPFIQTGLETFRKVRQGNELSFLAFKQLPWYHYPRLALESSQVVMRSPFLDNDLFGLSYRAPAECANSLELSLRLIYEGNPILGKIVTDRGMKYRPMLGIAAIQHMLHEFTFKAEYAYDYGMPQWLAGIDHMGSFLHLERAFLGRHKFYHFRIWFRDALAKYVKDILLDPRTLQRPYINGRRVETVVMEHTSGRGNFTNEIHMLLTSELTQRLLVERA